VRITYDRDVKIARGGKMGKKRERGLRIAGDKSRENVG